MSIQEPSNRYSVIREKNPREILLLRGNGCKWRRCSFCDYHLDFSRDEETNFLLNERELAKVTGCFKKLEVINSGSFCDLDKKTLERIRSVCEEKKSMNCILSVTGCTRMRFQRHGTFLLRRVSA